MENSVDSDQKPAELYLHTHAVLKQNMPQI